MFPITQIIIISAQTLLQEHQLRPKAIIFTILQCFYCMHCLMIFLEKNKYQQRQNYPKNHEGRPLDLYLQCFHVIINYYSKHHLKMYVRSINSKLYSNCHNQIIQLLIYMDIWNFKTQGFNYEKYRPAYPPELCRHAIQPLTNRRRYLDIAVGTGKILLSFCENFQEVKGIDLSDQMLSVAKANVSKFMETHPKNSSILLEKSHVMELNQEEKFDLITVGQALHFFPGENTLKKLKNMLNEGGMFMTFGYVLREVKSQNPKENQYFYKFYGKMLPYFTFDMYELHRHYTDQQKYPFEGVFQKVDRKQTDLVLEVSKEDYINYLKTWSAYNIYQEKEGIDPIVQLAEKSAEKMTCVFDYFRVRCFK